MNDTINFALLKAAKMGDLSGVKKALKKGATLDAKETAFGAVKWNALHWASWYGYSEIIDAIVSALGY